MYIFKLTNNVNEETFMDLKNILKVNIKERGK